MTDHDRQLPTFLREAQADDPELDLTPIGRLPELLQPERLSRAGLDRLMASVNEPPLRYAPFFDKLCTLWDLSEPEVVNVFERARDLKAWHKVPFFRIRLFDVEAGPQTHGARTRLIRFEPGVTLPKHRHPGPEALLALEGSYTDSLGRVIGPGDLHEMAPGSEHALYIDKQEPCVAAYCQYGSEFTGPFLSLLAKIVNR